MVQVERIERPAACSQSKPSANELHLDSFSALSLAIPAHIFSLCCPTQIAPASCRVVVCVTVRCLSGSDGVVLRGM
jgi:hypothetical protein